MIFGPKSAKQKPQRFPEPPLVGKQGVAYFALSYAAKTLGARNYLNYFEGGPMLVVYYLMNYGNNESSVSHFRGADCTLYDT